MEACAADSRNSDRNWLHREGRAMAIKSREITELLKQKIEKFDVPLFSQDVGVITDVGDGIAHVYGLAGVKAGEIVEFKEGIRGIALNLEEDSVGVIIMGEYDKLEEGDEAHTTGRIAQVPVGPGLIGRVVNSLGDPIDGKGPVDAAEQYPVELVAPGVIRRRSVKTPVQTGIKAIDAMIPIGRGQRELIIGDRQTGKSAIAIDTVINQKGGDLFCVYVCVGQNAQTVARLAATLEQNGAMEHTAVVAATSSEPAPLWYLAPYAGCAIGEYFMHQGKDALVIYDDLSKHAWAYRQISLLLRRPPGREAYPGAVFYLHSRLLERAARMNEENGGGSLTALPIIETLEGDISGYIPTNVISITDGQIFLEEGLFNAGVRPAINVGRSVSRVGGNAQIKAMKDVAGSLRLDLASFRELESFAAFGSELDKSSQAQLARGQRLVELLKQPQFSPVAVEDQVIAIFAGTKGYLDDVPVADVRRFEADLLEYVHSREPGITKEIVESGKMPEETANKLTAAIEDFKRSFQAAGSPDGLGDAQRTEDHLLEDKPEG